MNRAWRIGVLLGLGYLGLQWQQGNLHFLKNPSKLAGDTCAGKKRCVVAYLAPWCPSCRAELPHTQEMLSRSRTGDTGMKIVVGMERKPGDNAEMGRRIASAGITLDDTTELARKWDIRAVPAYVVLDPEGAKILDGQEARQWVDEKFAN